MIIAARQNPHIDVRPFASLPRDAFVLERVRRAGNAKFTRA
ncbi:hypothetical protein [Piscinibacter koreensis]|nr:hypothetical protein [Schlegelella koreensis]